MAWAPKKICAWRGCGRTQHAKFCATHAIEDEARRKQRAAEHDRQRGSAAKRLYGRQWQKRRLEFLAEHPLCMCPDCGAGKKRVLAATVVDHIVPHKGDERLFWDESNWQAMSHECHSAKTAREDGAFGNPRGRGRGVSIAGRTPRL